MTNTRRLCTSVQHNKWQVKWQDKIKDNSMRMNQRKWSWIEIKEFLVATEQLVISFGYLIVPLNLMTKVKSLHRLEWSHKKVKEMRGAYDEMEYWLPKFNSMFLFFPLAYRSSFDKYSGSWSLVPGFNKLREFINEFGLNQWGIEMKRVRRVRWW